MTSPLADYLLESAAVLVVVIGLGALVLHAARRAGVARSAGPLELLARLPLEARRSVYVVRVQSQVLILGASEGGLSKLGELPESAADELRRAPAAPAWASLGLSRARRTSSPP